MKQNNLNHHISSLYQISLNIGTSLDLQELVDNALSSYIAHIDCIGGAILKKQKNDFEILCIKPKILRKQVDFFDFLKNELENKEFQTHIVVPYSDAQYCYIAKLGDVGYLVLIKSEDFSDEYFLRFLESLNDKLTNAIITCINSQRVRDMEQELIISSRNGAMGEAISMIAHQWRQPLSGISSISSGMQLHYELGIFDEKVLMGNLDIILSYVQYLSEIIDDFRNFFKPDKDVEIFKVSEIVTKTKNILGDTLKSHQIELVLNFENDATICGYRNELIQVILNILNNAKDALKDKNISKKMIFIDIKNNGTNVLIDILDNGGGIDEKIIDRIFEPYFSTKGKNGTGIGLHMSKTIIEQHLHGSISARNEVDGALFEISLPKNIG